MRTLRMAAVLVATALASSSAPAQTVAHNITGQTTETQEREAAGIDKDLIWNLVGLLGLIGLIGLLPQHEEDSYHPSSFDE